jgi:acetate kinase
MKVLVVNAGSSSLKYKVLDMVKETEVCSGLVERIGLSEAKLTHKIDPGSADETIISISEEFNNHTEAIEKVAELLLGGTTGVIQNQGELMAIGHRVAHGGERFSENCIVDEEVLAGIEDNIKLAPLHNPANLAGIKAALKLFPDTPSVAVFDTQFSKDLPAYAYRYAVPEEFYTAHKVRRYGFHGTSHSFVTSRLANLMEKDPTEINNIVCHLGNGSSMTAVRGGKCIDTSMGMTPTAGLIMGTRSGDIDPSLHKYLAVSAGLTLDEIDEALNKKSGLSGVCTLSDMRDIHGAIEKGDKKAKLALEMLTYSIKKYIGSYHAVLGRLDAIVFTAGIGENDPEVRRLALEGLAPMGIELDVEVNDARFKEPKKISSSESRVDVWVIPTNEELEIALGCRALVM